MRWALELHVGGRGVEGPGWPKRFLKERDERERLSERERLFFDALYSVTALRKTGGEEAVYAKHQELKQASKQAPNQDTSR